MLDLAVRALSHLLTPMFVVGMAGSALVVIVTLTRDVADFLSDGGAEDGSHETLSGR